MSMSATPNLFIIGMPKCGTTALAAYLQNHSDVLMSVPKEPHYFDTYYEDMTLEEYIKRCYGNFKGEKIIGEATPVYLIVPWALERLAKHYPKAKYIAIFRNPVDRAYSHWWMFYSRAMDSFSFEEAIEECLKQSEKELYDPVNWKTERKRMRKGQSLIMRPYLSNGYYARYLNSFFRWFDRKQLLVIQTEEFNRDTLKVIKDVCEFLQINSYSGNNIRRHNEAYGSAARKVFTLIKGMGLVRFTQSVPESVRGNIKRVLAGVGERKPVMHRETRKKLALYYAPYNHELENLLGRRFSWE
ncbi:MAG TPA: sulfotransferase [Deltaproteobacteria bacterium]|nr:sulfotransferase [Deltaproteobacteria bacterium]